MDTPVQSVEEGSIAGPSCLDPAVSHAELAAFGKAVPAERGHTLYGFWLERWRPGRPPSRADLLPEELGPLLPQTFLIEVEPGSGRLRYRLVGSGIAAGLGYDSSGRYLDEVSAGFPEEVLERWRWRDRLTAEQARPVYSAWRLDYLQRGWRTVTSLRLPLLEDGRVTHLLGYGTVA